MISMILSQICFLLLIYPVLAMSPAVSPNLWRFDELLGTMDEDVAVGESISVAFLYLREEGSVS